jgi:glycosyltransferase involved in cell wall biosynthesis
MSNQLVSIVIPTYNRSEYLSESIDSVLRQTYKDWELIIVDDGSTDSTPKLMEYYLKLDERIKYYRKKNEGIAKTRNFGIKKSQGEYISVHDSDDIMMPKKLALSLRKLNKTNADFVYTSYFMMDNDSKPYGVHQPPYKITIQQIIDNAAFPHITILAKRKCFIENPYRNELKVNDDMGLCADFYMAGYKFERIKEPLSMVRYHNTRISIGKVKEIEKITKQIQKELIDSGVS